MTTHQELEALVLEWRASMSGKHPIAQAYLEAKLDCADELAAILAKPFDVSVTYEVWQDDMCQAGSNDLGEAIHYASEYGQDGPVKLVKVTSHTEDVTTALNPKEEGDGLELSR